MLLFRILCAILVAWAVNWALARPEAVEMLTEVPEMRLIGPIAGGVIGYFNLAVRQGWGPIVAVANGIWAGALSVGLAGILYLTYDMSRAIATNVVRDVDGFFNVFGAVFQPLVEQVVNIPLLTVSLGATAVVGLLTEIVHWVMVRARHRKPGARRMADDY